MENKIEKINNSLVSQDYESLKNELFKMLENQNINKKNQAKILKTTQKGFIGIALQNTELLELNKKLTEQLEIVVEELNQIKQEREEKTARKEAWANRKRLSKRDPMTGEIYRELMRVTEGPTYINLRTRMALCILAVTGIHINELLPLKVSQLETLFKENWIVIDRPKRGLSNHKAFLTKEGKKIIQDRQKDFQLIFLIKELDSYVFTAEANHYKSLDRVVSTRDVNKVMREVSNQLPDKPNITSHSFRIGSIIQLWKDTKDIEFVKQTMSHRTLDTTSAYVSQMTDQERQKRISSIQ